MADNETRIRITAVDDATKTLNSIRGATKDLTGDFGKLGGALSALGVSGALAGLAATVKGAIDAAASMQDLSQKTGIATKELTALDYAMRREGVSTEAFAKGVKELSKNLVEAGDASSKAGKLFTILGVDLNSGPRDALLKIADTFKALPDGVTKATLATQLFGKAGTDLIPALNNGAAGIREIEEEARRLGITFDSDTGRAAKEFSDKMFALQESSKKLGISLAEQLLPGLNRVGAAMVEAAKDGGILKTVFVGLGGLMSEALGLNNDDAQNTKQRIGEIREELGKLETIQGRIRENSGKVDAELAARIKGLREELSLLGRVAQAVADANAGKFEDANDRRRRQGVDLSLGRRIDDVLSGDKKVEADPTRNLLISLQLEYAKLNDVTKENETLERVLAEFKKEAYANASKGLKDQAVAQAKLIDQKKAAVKAAADLAKIDADTLAETARLTDAALQLGARRVLQVQDEIDRYQLETSVIGLTNEEREREILLFQKNIALRGVIDENDRKAIENKYDELAVLVKLREARLQDVTAQKEMVSMWSQVGDIAGNFFADLVMNGKSAFDSLKEQLKSFVRELLALVAKRWFLQLVAGVTGGGGGGGIGSAAASAGANSLAGSVVSGLGNWAASTAIGSYAAGAYSSFAAGWQGSTLAAGLAGPTTAGAGGLTGIGATMSSWWSAINPYLWIIAGVLKSFSLYNSGWRGDPNDTGVDALGRIEGTPIFSPGAGVSMAASRGFRAMGMSDKWAAILSGTTGIQRLFGLKDTHADARGVRGTISGLDLMGENWQDLSQQGGFFRSDRRWTENSAFSTDQSDFFKAIMQGIGSTVGRFGSMLSVDPRQALAGYTSSFNIQTTNDGKPLSDAELQTLLGDYFGGVLQEQTAILLQSAGRTRLADYVRDLKGAGEEIASTIQELAGVMEGVTKLNAKGLSVEALMDWQREGESLGDAFQRVATQFAQFDDAFTTEAEKFQKANAYVVGSFEALGIAMPATAKDFYTLVHGLDLSTEAGRNLFDALMDVAPAFLQVENYVKSMVDSIIGNLRGPEDPRLGLNRELDTFIANNSWAAGMTREAVLAAIQTITPEDAAAYVRAGQGDNLNAIGFYFRQTQGGGTGGASDVGGGTTGFNHNNYWSSFIDAAKAASELAAALADAKEGLRDYLDSLLLNENLSPLDPQERLAEAARQFQTTLGLAQGGDLSATAELSSVADTYLRIARETFGSSSPYIKIFKDVFDSVSGVADGPSFDERMLGVQTDVYQTLMTIRDRADQNANYISNAVLDAGDKIVAAVRETISDRR